MTRSWLPLLSNFFNDIRLNLPSISTDSKLNELCQLLGRSPKLSGGSVGLYRVHKNTVMAGHEVKLYFGDFKSLQRVNRSRLDCLDSLALVNPDNIPLDCYPRNLNKLTVKYGMTHLMDDHVKELPACATVILLTNSNVVIIPSTVTHLTLSPHSVVNWLDVPAGWIPESVTYLKFEMPYRAVFHPDSIPERVVHFEMPDFIMMMVGAKLPLSIKTLRVSKNLSLLNLPPNVETLIFPSQYFQSITCELPRSITSLEFEKGFTQHVSVELPPNLQRLDIGGAELAHHFIPPLVNTIRIGIDGLLDHFPEHLESLTLSDHFDQRLQAGSLPQSLTSLTFGKQFNQELKDMVLPRRLVNLKFGENFDKELHKPGTLPGTLKVIKFGGKFNCKLPVGTIPASVTRISFGGMFNRDLMEGWAPSLRKLVLSYGFNSFGPHCIPPTVEKLWLQMSTRLPAIDGIPFGHMKNVRTIKHCNHTVYIRRISNTSLLFLAKQSLNCGFLNLDKGDNTNVLGILSSVFNPLPPD
ncbi:hypothetical protein SAMD00019534_051640 [Acytostelium subglobosum LB1]|uniref:hypothetical protein n=1 Tax=Acytostelium subglobosum LB1 TaxID=1410327 RepID=UPI000644FBAB|nr:hypothetical protein SAMD00019534_051640 [Acytostelium subglobosum LB1]GAM21989.1 hypothetical protein SAMD00019534_051640 [Acytostelium subglobosum LB1]|eukprot:XP_012755089.1 hypothetical protein SAMD00019534_051640 [Acytostelium subglobosum LB1]